MNIDYKKLGFKCGIEIHQQLETHKLFCNCPSVVNDKTPDITFALGIEVSDTNCLKGAE